MFLKSFFSVGTSAKSRILCNYAQKRFEALGKRFTPAQASFSSQTSNKHDVLKSPLTYNEEVSNVPHVQLGKKLPSVTRILSATKPAEQQLILLNWKKKMIAELGEEGFYKMQKETLAAGTSCHSLIEQCLKGTPMNEISPGENSVKLWQSVTSVLDEVNDMIATEHKVTHSYLGYSGYLDCIANYKGQTCLIDWKTSKKPKYKLQDCYDDPVQIAAYVGAYNSSSGVKNQIVNGVVVKIYHDGKPASAFQINDFMMQFYWRKWLERLALYHDIVSNNTNT